MALFFAMAAAAIYPSLGQLHSTLPTGPTNVVTVPLFNAWTIWWNIDRATHGFVGYWDAPIFHPATGAFAFSEPQPMTLLVAPVYWATGSLIVAYKAYLVLSLVLNGFFAAKLCRRLRVGWPGCLAAGAMMVWLPLGLRQLDVLQLIPVWGILWTWDAAWQHCRCPTYRSAVVAAAACAACFMMSVHHGLFMIIVLLPALLLTLPWRRVIVAWRQSVIAILLAGIAVGALALPMRSIMATYKFERTQKLVTNLSAEPKDLLRLPKEALVGKVPDGEGYRLHPGWAKLFLAAIGIAAGLFRRRKRRWAVFFLLMLLMSAILALGPHFRVGTYEPWWTLAEIVPGLQQVRNVFRFAYLTQMVIIVFAAVGLNEISMRLRVRFRKPIVAHAVIVVMALVCVSELPPPNPVLAGVPNRERHRAWTSFVKQEIRREASIVCLPFAATGSVADFDVTTRWMYFGTLHGAPMLNGYSGYFPEQYFTLRDSFNLSGITDSVLQQFAADGVQLVVIQRQYVTADAVSRLPLNQFRLQLAFSDDDMQVDVYRLIVTEPGQTAANAAAEFVTSPISWLAEQIRKQIQVNGTPAD